MSNHTPGPWRIDKNDNPRNPGYHCRGDCNGQAFEVVFSTPDIRQADARLVAAAPELLSALKDAEFLLRKSGQIAGPMQDSYNRSAADARTAIAHAEGN